MYMSEKNNMILVSMEEAVEVSKEISALIAGIRQGISDENLIDVKEKLAVEYEEWYATTHKVCSSGVWSCLLPAEGAALDELEEIDVLVELLSRFQDYALYCSKALRFGLSDINPKTGCANSINLCSAAKSCFALTEYLLSRSVLHKAEAAGFVQTQKLGRVAKYYQYSLEKQTLLS